MSVASAARERTTLLHVSLIVEALRARPSLMFWVAALGQAALWALVPALFYAAPPGDMPLVLAVGREWTLGSPYGPPFAYWLAELAFRLTGGRVIGLYLLSQGCVVVTFWAVFTLGRRIVGAAHATMAILLMTGVTVFTIPTLEFGPGVLAMALSAVALLFLYRALAENRGRDWLGAGIALGLLLLTSYAGLILIGLVALYVAMNERGRARLATPGPWGAAFVIVLINLPHLIWLDRSGIDPVPGLAALSNLVVVEQRLLAWFELLLWLLFAHAGAVVLLLVAGGVLAGSRAGAPVFERQPLDPFARSFVYWFALAPAFVATLLAVLLGRRTPIGGAGPVVVLSGLAVIVAAGDTIRLYRQRIGALVWLALLLAPPGIIVAATVTLPWTVAVDLEVSKPASAMGQFFTETFRRRTGKPLTIVVGDVRTAGLVALASPDRPSLYVDASPERAPWLNDDAVRERGAVMVWAATDTAGSPPAGLRARFPEMVPEVPRSFARTLQGRLPLLRVGWTVIRPRAQGASEQPAQ
jgi:4-amino-4-deoxy-L-arabinose transferase-like glycosyltransferase